MRYLTLILLSLLSTEVFAKKMYEKLEGKRYYFSALNIFFKEVSVRNVTEDDVEVLDRLLQHTGIEVLDGYETEVLAKYPTGSTQFVLARRALKEKKFSRSLELIKQISKSHHFYPEAMFLKGQVYGEQKDINKEYQAYGECYNAAIKRVKQKGYVHYFKVLSEICLSDRARTKYDAGKLKDAVNEYSKIPKNSYKWPYLLLERAWAYYRLGDYNRALGLIVTYKSPLLDTYFFPEAEYLASLIYYKLCLFKDSSAIIQHYYKFYRPRYVQLEKVLRENKNSNTFFYNLMFRPEKQKAHGEFVKQIVVRLKKESRFNFGMTSILRVNHEMKLIKKNEKTTTQNLLMPHLKEVNKNMYQRLNGLVKVEIFNFLKTVSFFSSELYKIDLEILSKSKDLIYENKKFISDRSRGDLGNVKRSPSEYFWTFEKAFWADELGDYSFALKSNCQTIERTKAKK